MRELWTDGSWDLCPMWRPILGYVAIDFHAIVAALMLEPWEHILPARRGQNIPGAAKARTCCMRSKASIRPAEVRCVILGQGPQLRFRCWSRLIEDIEPGDGARIRRRFD
jgi:hypothetical protein